MLEMLQAKLELMCGNTVIFVRPMFGKQSDSFVGELSQSTIDKEMFCISSDSFSSMFSITDVSSTELQDGSKRLIVRLKGLGDY